MEKLLKHVTLNTVLLLLMLGGLFVVEASVLNVRGIALGNAVGIKASRDVAAALAAHNEKISLDFMARTVARWDALQRNNPQIIVPKVTEPLDSPLLDENQLKRP